MWESGLFWQAMACDNAKGLLLVQLVCCLWRCPLQKCLLPVTSDCKIYFVQSCCVHLTSGIRFCSSLNNISILTNSLRSDLVLPLFLFYYSLSILRWILDAEL